MSNDLKLTLLQTILNKKLETFSLFIVNDENRKVIQKTIDNLVEGEYCKVILNKEVLHFVENDELNKILTNIVDKNFFDVINRYCEKTFEIIDEHFKDRESSLIYALCIAIAFFQLFLQANFTGPEAEIKSDFFFKKQDIKKINERILHLLEIESQTVYKKLDESFFFLFSSLLFDRIIFFDNKYTIIGCENISEEEFGKIKNSVSNNQTNDIVLISLWWRFRVIQVHMILFSEIPHILAKLCVLLMSEEVLNMVKDTDDLELQKQIEILFHLEIVRFYIHIKTEFHCLKSLKRILELSELNFVITGVRCKKTKYQKFYGASLILLARSRENDLEKQVNDFPETVDLNSDLLLERPHFESLDDIKTESIVIESEDKKKLIFFCDIVPTAFKSETVCEELQKLDPNNQPSLNDLDNMQILLRFLILKQISPYKDELATEQLFALISRILNTNEKKTNWLIFSRALWERSILETNKSKTLERGILQMTSLIEESGIKIKNAFFSSTEENKKIFAKTRLKYIHQLPLLPQWHMNVVLAEKYMSIGVVKSALEIYERLEMDYELALCYLITEQEKKAEEILLKKLELEPNDGRALSILGEIRNDPELFRKSWELGRYTKSLALLSKYYYNLRIKKDHEKNLEYALNYMKQYLSINTFDEEKWFFFGCCYLEKKDYDLASKAFTECVTLNPTSCYSWSNLSSCFIKVNKYRPALNALKNAISNASGNKTLCKIYENYVYTAYKLSEWSDVLLGLNYLIKNQSDQGNGIIIDIHILEKLVDFLLSTEYPKKQEKRVTFFQRECINLICKILPQKNTSSFECWEIIAKVHLWMGNLQDAINYYEKSFRVLLQSTELKTNIKHWQKAVSFGIKLTEIYNMIDQVNVTEKINNSNNLNWVISKSKMAIVSLISKGMNVWEETNEFKELLSLKDKIEIKKMN